MNYYNEIDPKAAAWLEELIAEGHLPYGEVDQRSITDVSPTDLSGFAQCHFFAGIGGWSLALALAGWPEDRPVWTGSCPCQPFSSAGKQMGRKDPRHLWPAFRRLINRCRPPVVFGEQVASKDGRKWLAGVFANLETMGYAPAGADLCAASCGAPHIRQRLWWVAHSSELGCIGRWSGQAGDGGDAPRLEPNRLRATGRLADSDGKHTGAERQQRGGQQRLQPEDGGARRVAHGTSLGRGEERQDSGGFTTGDRAEGRPAGSKSSGDACGVGHAIVSGLEGQPRNGHGGHEPGRIATVEDRPTSTTSGSGHWSAFDLIPCRDGKARRVEPGTFPLAHGIPARMGRLRGYGNAIVPQVAAEFIAAYLETL